MEPDRNAPVSASAEEEIQAPIDVVWRVLSDLSGWTDWNPDVRSMDVRGPIEPGTTFVWKAGGLTIRSRIEEVVPPERIVWTGRTVTIRAVHAWVLEDRGGTTVVRTEESFAGPVASLFARPLRRTLEQSLNAGLEALSAACER